MTFVEVVALHLRLDGVVVDQQTLGTHYDALCASGTRLACDWRAWDDWGRVKPDALLRILDGECAAGNAEACVAFGVALAPSHPTRAKDLLGPACEAGSGRACLELGRLAEDDEYDEDGDGASLRARACSSGLAEACAEPVDPVQGCAAGRTTSCEALLPAVEGPDRIRALERLCHAGLRCPELAEARAAGERGALQARPVACATWIEAGVLLGWDGPTFADHAFVPIDDLAHVTLVVAGSRHERFVLAPITGAPIELPDLGCDAVIAGARALAAGGRLARAQDPSGLPERSQCVAVLSPSTPYRSGRLTVDGRAGDEDLSAAVRDALTGAVEGMWRCAEAAPYRAHLEPFTATLVHARSGPPRKVTPSGSSGDVAFDECVLAWLRGVELGGTPYRASHTVRVELTW